MGKTLSRLIREYVAQHPGCTPWEVWNVVGKGSTSLEFTQTLYQLVDKCEIRGIIRGLDSRLYISSVRNVSSAVCK